MKRIAAKILCAVLVILSLSGTVSAQDRPLRLGFQTSPVFSWVRNNDDLILRNGGNFGIKLGASADVFFKDNLSFTMGFNLGFHEGGEFLYEIGGNYLPESDLSDPALQTGDKPLPDGVKIHYNLQYLEFPLGFKMSTKQKGYFRYFLEAPVFTFSFLTRGRGDIETDDYLKEQENIYKDLKVSNIFWGLGGGVEYSISEHNALIGGIYFQKGLFDFTKDNGYRAILNPDIIPMYLTQEDDSRATVSNLIIKLGILF